MGGCVVISPMGLWAAAIWGFMGAGAIEAWDLYGAIHRVKGFPWRMPDEVAFAPYLVSVFIRVLLGVGMAIAFVASGQADGPVGVLAIGIAAPKLLEQLARQAVSQAASETAPGPSRPRRAPTSVGGGRHAP
jgi:hypothetical protein